MAYRRASRRTSRRKASPRGRRNYSGGRTLRIVVEHAAPVSPTVPNAPQQMASKRSMF